MTAYFTAGTFQFLADLRQNNNREWFEANRQRYEDSARQPMLRFIADLAPRLREVGARDQADPRPSGGSMMRIFRDVRFSKDKSPYKTALAAHFGHDAGTEDACPAFYLHLEPGDVAAGAGVWRPAPAALGRIRDAIVARPDDWRRATAGFDKRSSCGMAGEKLSRAPKGYDPAHPLVEDLKRKDFAVRVDLSEADVVAPDFLDRYVGTCARLAPIAGFLADALGLPD